VQRQSLATSPKQTEAQLVPKEWLPVRLTPPSPPLSLGVMLYGMEYPFGQLSWLCPLTASCPPLAYSLWEGGGEKKRKP